MVRKSVIMAIIFPVAAIYSAFAAADGKPFRVTAAMVEQLLLSPERFIESSGSGDKQIIIKNRIFRSYTGSLTNLVRDGSIIAIANSIAGITPSGENYTSLASLQSISGLPVFTKTVNNDTVTMSGSSSKSFSHVNPDFVRWASRYCVPEPSMKVAGVSCRDIYRVVFSRLFRMLAESRLELAKEGAYKNEVTAYAEAMKKPGFMGVFYLEEKFAGRLPEYVCTDMDVPPSYQPQMAFGFWLRRGIDGSSDEIWKGLAQFMTKYDGRWFASKTKKGG